MKTKPVLIIVLTAVLGGGILWVAVAQPSGASERESAKMVGHMQNAAPSGASRSTTIYTCPMHPSVKADKPGDCPICGMALRPVYGNTAGTNAPPAAAPTNRPTAAMPGCCSPGGCCR